MSTLTRRDPRPDRKTADMSQNDEAANSSGTPSFADRRQQHAWVPGITALLTLLIGITDIIQVFRPGWPHRFHTVRPFVPGTLTNVSHTADVIIGLLLVMFAHGLRRRKRRAWQAVTALLAFDVGIHFFSHSRRITGVTVAIVVLVGLLYFRDEFYAEGDLRNRLRAMWVFCWLVVADIAIGLVYIGVAGGLASDYSLWQRTQEVVYGLVGISGQIYWLPEAEARADTFNLLTSALGIFTLVVTAYLFLRQRSRGPG
jgi:lysyl-tRNA synthetase, class II